MRVRLRIDITGSRNGVEWPPRGSMVDLPDQEAKDLCEAGMADPVTTFQKAETAVAPQAEERTAASSVLTTASLASPEDAGRVAALAGQSRSSNPYDGRSADGRAWLKGWDGAAAEGAP